MESVDDVYLKQSASSMRIHFSIGEAFADSLSVDVGRTEREMLLYQHRWNVYHVTSAMP